MRGAPAIGVAAAFGVALAGLASPARDPDALLGDIETAIAGLAATRPTAVNLFWALERMDATRVRPGTSRWTGCERAWCGRRRRSSRRTSRRTVGSGPGSRTGPGARTDPDPLQRRGARDGRLRDGAGHRPRRRRGRAAAFRLGRRDAPGPPGGATDRVGAGARGDPPRGHRRRRCGLDDGTRRGGSWSSWAPTGSRRTGTRPTRSGPTAWPCWRATMGSRSTSPRPSRRSTPGSRTGRPFPSRSGTPARCKSFGGRRIVPAASAAYNPAFDVTPAALITAIVTERGIFRHPYRFEA